MDDRSEHRGFVIYRDSEIFVKRLPDEEAGKLFKGIFRYLHDRTIPTFENDMTAMAFEMTQSYLDRDEAKYAAKCEKNRKNINKRWGNTDVKKNPKDTNEYDRIRANTNYTDIDTETGTDSDTGTDSASDSGTGIDRETETETEIDRTSVFGSEARPPSDGQAAVGRSGSDLFSIDQLLKKRDSGKVNLSNDGVKVFLDQMREDGWTLYDRPVEKKNILRVLREWANKHSEYGIPEKVASVDRNNSSGKEEPHFDYDLLDAGTYRFKVIGHNISYYSRGSEMDISEIPNNTQVISCILEIPFTDENGNTSVAKVKNELYACKNGLPFISKFAECIRLCPENTHSSVNLEDMDGKTGICEIGGLIDGNDFFFYPPSKAPKRCMNDEEWISING